MVSQEFKPTNEAVQSGAVSQMEGKKMLGATTDAELVEELVSRFGGPHAVLDQISSTLVNEAPGGSGAVGDAIDENTHGYCYLRLFDRVEHRDAILMGPFPTVAEIRRFSNGRRDPFGLRTVEVLISYDVTDRVAHVRFRSGVCGLRPVSALAALSKDCVVGGLTFGPDSSARKILAKLSKDRVAGGLMSSFDLSDKKIGRTHLLSLYAESMQSEGFKLMPLDQFLELHGSGGLNLSGRCTTLATDWAMVCVPDGLPYNIPDPGRYPYSRYTGLQAFATALPYSNMWSFLYDIGAKRDQTPDDSFWTQAFGTGIMLSAYFKLLAEHRTMFVQMVAWLRDPLPGRPGGVQIVPPEWPGVIPTPLHHTMTRYAGIAEWVQTLADPWPEVCRMALFGVHEPFDPVWWEDYHKTVDVYILYTRLSPPLRQSFSQAVYWIPDGTPEVVSELKSEPDDSGFCYLKLFRASSRPRIRARLGSNPWASAVAAALTSLQGSWSSAKFLLTVAEGKAEDGLAFQQGHITISPDGLSVGSLLGVMSGVMRVGATNDLNALADVGEEQIAVRPTIFPTVPVRAGEGMVLSFNLFGVLGKDTIKYPPIAFNVLQEPVLTMMLGVYESVELITAKFFIDVPTGAQNGIYAAVCAPSVSLITDLDWLSAPVNLVVYGSDQGHVHANFELPQVHPFEKELRAGSFVGNPIPTFRFSFAGNAGAIGVVKGQLVVRCRGQYAMGHLRIGAPQTGKSLRAEVVRMHETMGYDEMGSTKAPVLDADDADSFEDDRPSRHSPKAIAAASKTAAS